MPAFETATARVQGRTVVTCKRAESPQAGASHPLAAARAHEFEIFHARGRAPDLRSAFLLDTGGKERYAQRSVPSKITPARRRPPSAALHPTPDA